MLPGSTSFVETWKRATSLNYNCFFNVLLYSIIRGMMNGCLASVKVYMPLSTILILVFTYIYVSINDMCIDKLDNELLGFTAPVVKSVPVQLLPDLSA